MLDIDDVVLDFENVFMNLMNSVYNKNIKWSDISTFKFHNSGVCTEKQENQVFDQFLRNGMFRGLKPVTGAIESIKLLLSMGWIVQFITSRPILAYSDTITRLESLGLGHIPVHFSTKNKKKAEIIREIGGATAFVDDHPVYVAEVKNAFPEMIVINLNKNDRCGSEVSDLSITKTKNWGETMYHLLSPDVPEEYHL